MADTKEEVFRSFLMRNYLVLNDKNNGFYARENIFNHLRIRFDIAFDTVNQSNISNRYPI